MSRLQLRFPLGLGHELREIVFAHGGRHETVTFCLVSHTELDGVTVLVVRHVLKLGEADYLRDSGHGAAWSGASMLPAIETAMQEGLGIVVVHAHDFGGHARLSTDDLTSARRLVPMFCARVPGRPHGSIVLGRGTAAGFVALPGEGPRLIDDVSVRWMGSAIENWPRRGGDLARDLEIFDRQALVVGDQGTLATASAVVVGLCGGGSHVVQQLAHSGIGTIVGIDPDVSDRTNLHRQVGMRPSDADRKRLKTKIMARLVRSIGTGTNFVGIEGRVPERHVLEALKRADVIVGCIDNLHARADLQEIAWRYCIPYLDVGVSIRPLTGTASDPRVSIGGNVLVLIPGGFCMWCSGFLSDEKLREELEGKDRSYFQGKKGEAQVVSLNGVVASQAVTEALQLLTGFRGSSVDPAAVSLEEDLQRGAFKLDGVRGTLLDWGARRRATCPNCAVRLSAGSALWRAA
jgi:hypothetical protein